MVVSTHLAYYQGYRAGDFTEVDGSRIAASVVSGIGFLAGGAILRTGFSVPARSTDKLITRLTELDLVPTVEGWNQENQPSLRQLTLVVRLPRDGGESTLIAALEAEPGIARMQLDPPS
jgi:hypothetical protein